jgi:hypothetical protein
MWGFGSPAIASIHTYPEGGERVMVRSLQTLRDRQDQAWQLALFQRMNQGRIESVHLRLVGFPGGAEVQHPEPLRMASSTQGWTAPDVLQTESAYPSNVGEYDVMEVMRQLGNAASLQVVLPLQTGDVELVVPPFVVKEWRQLLQMQGSGS